jgi:hypothetical protein
MTAPTGAVTGRHIFTVTRAGQPAHVPTATGWGYRCTCGSSSGNAWLSEAGARMLGLGHAPGAVERIGNPDPGTPGAEPAPGLPPAGHPDPGTPGPAERDDQADTDGGAEQ